MSAPRITSFSVRNRRNGGAETLSMRFPTAAPLVLARGAFDLAGSLEVLFGTGAGGPAAAQLVAEVENFPCSYCDGFLYRLSCTTGDGAPEYRQKCLDCGQRFVTPETRSRLAVARTENPTGQLAALRSDRGLVLLVDEPEHTLDRPDQRWLARRFGVPPIDGLQIVLTTTSARFLGSPPFLVTQNRGAGRTTVPLQASR